MTWNFTRSRMENDSTIFVLNENVAQLPNLFKLRYCFKDLLVVFTHRLYWLLVQDKSSNFIKCRDDTRRIYSNGTISDGSKDILYVVRTLFSRVGRPFSNRGSYLFFHPFKSFMFSYPQSLQVNCKYVLM